VPLAAPCARVSEFCYLSAMAPKWIWDPGKMEEQLQLAEAEGLIEPRVFPEDEQPPAQPDQSPSSGTGS
jgi:hypothetical protein